MIDSLDGADERAGAMVRHRTLKFYPEFPPERAALFPRNLRCKLACVGFSRENCTRNIQRSTRLGCKCRSGQCLVPHINFTQVFNWILRRGQVNKKIPIHFGSPRSPPSLLIHSPVIFPPVGVHYDICFISFVIPLSCQREIRSKPY